MATVDVVVGLGFGDEGKGATTDHLCRRHRAKLVVRFNGGAQAGHNVVDPDGRHHCFAQWGSGTFAGARTHLSRFMLVNPLCAFVEGRKLERSGIRAPLSLLTVEREALITTPFHVAANRLRELHRAHSVGLGAHGSCGMGIGETMSDSLSSPGDALVAGDLLSDVALRRKLHSVRHRKLSEISALPAVGGPVWERELDVLADAEVCESTLDAYRSFGQAVTIVDRSWLDRELKSPGHIVFEGAQGVLLDQDHGFQPHTTWTKCTFENAERLISGKAPHRRLGVLRTYHTRHGAGPFPTEHADFDAWSADDHNRQGDWQGRFRSGAFDVVLAQHALNVAGGCDALALTHMDKVPVGRVRVKWSEGGMIDFCTSGPREGGVSSYYKMISERLRTPIALLSYGKTANDRYEVEKEDRNE